MSLINDALNDLEARNFSLASDSIGVASPRLSSSPDLSSPDLIAQAATNTSSEVFFAHLTLKIVKGLSIAALVGLFFILAHTYFLGDLTILPDSQHPGIAPSQDGGFVNDKHTIPESLQTGENKTDKFETASPSASQTTTKAPVGIQILDQAHDTLAVDNQASKFELTILLDLGDKALEKKRLTTPEGASAYHFYQQALSFDGESIRAKAGIERVKEEYLSLIERAYDRASLDQASTLKSRLWAISNTSEHNIYLEKIRAIESDYLKESNEEKSTIDSNIVTATSTNFGSEAMSQMESTFPVEISISQDQKRQNILTRYGQYISRKEVTEARLLLERHVLDTKSNPLLIEKLFDHYFRYDSEKELVFLFRQRQQYDEKWPFQKARYLQIYQGEEKAVDFLSSQYQLNKLPQEQAKLLYATLLRKRDEFELSVIVYRELLEINSKEPLYWLGLAIAEESQSNYDYAHKAYNLALKYGEKNTEVSSFIHTRLVLLNAHISSSAETKKW